MKNSALILLILAVSGLACRAQTSEELGVANRSVFNDTAERRDPFLPIGWKRPPSGPELVLVKGVNVPVTTESYIRPDAFSVTSIALDRIPLAVINGKPYGEGDVIPFVAGDKPIKLRIYSIRDGVVTLSYNDYKVTCPIRLWQKPATQATKPAP
ncbi:MAG: hypothetical protein WCI40_06410 [Verrucomicrobiota bacterium]